LQKKSKTNVHLFHFFSSLLVISEVTLFFKENELQNSIALTLTVLLVMYTMYQSIIETATKTAYLKFIDFWLLFCLLIPFMTFVLEVYWYLSPADINRAKRTRNSFQKCVNQIFEQKFMQKFIPFFTIVFILAYVLTAIAVTVIYG
jgi:hypothetical protein